MLLPGIARNPEKRNGSCGRVLCRTLFAALPSIRILNFQIYKSLKGWRVVPKKEAHLDLT